MLPTYSYCVDCGHKCYKSAYINKPDLCAACHDARYGPQAPIGESMGTQPTNDDAGMGLEPFDEATGPMETRPDSTRRVAAIMNDVTKWGVVLGEDEAGDFGWFSSSGLYLWVGDSWRLTSDYAPIWTKKECQTNRPTVPPPDWKSDEATTAAVIRDEQRMADVFQEAMLAVIAVRAAAEGFDAVQSYLSISTRFALATRLESAANALESAIARANGGAAMTASEHADAAWQLGHELMQPMPPGWGRTLHELRDGSWQVVMADYPNCNSNPWPERMEYSVSITAATLKEAHEICREQAWAKHRKNEEWKR